MFSKIKRSIDGFSLTALGVTATYVGYTLLAALFVLIWWEIDRGGMVLPLSAPWHQHGSLLTGLSRVWFIFAWGTGITLGQGIFLALRKRPREAEPLESLVKGWWLSLNAGFFEEIIFRWLVFFSCMVLVRFFNVITFHLVHWFYVHWLIPWTDWLTMGHLHSQLTGMGWILAAAVISSNSHFEDRHEYLGWFGKLNSWFIGMVMFWLMFNYGLWTAIAAHVLYDICVFSSVALTNALRPRPRAVSLANLILR